MVSVVQHRMTIDELLERLYKPLPKVPILADKTALLLVDMQKLTGVEYIAEAAASVGVDKAVALEVLSDMDRRIKSAIKNANAILTACRRKGVTVIHVKIQSRTLDGRDVGRLHRKHSFIVPPGAERGEFFEEVIPQKGEIVLTKTCSGAFIGTDVDRILRDLGVETLIIAGFYTDQCVETTARDAADAGYDVILVEDACATLTAEGHRNTLRAIGDLYVKLETTSGIVRDIDLS